MEAWCCSNVVVWRSIRYEFRPWLVVIQIALNTQWYIIHSLNPHVLPLMKQYFNNTMLVHIQHVSMNCLHDNEVLLWPAISPDVINRKCVTSWDVNSIPGPVFIILQTSSTGVEQQKVNDSLSYQNTACIQVKWGAPPDWQQFAHNAIAVLHFTQFCKYWNKKLLNLLTFHFLLYILMLNFLCQAEYLILPNSFKTNSKTTCS